MVNIEKKWLEVPHLLFGYLTKYYGSLYNPSQANGDFREQIFARDCNNSGETGEVCTYLPKTCRISSPVQV